MRLTLLGTGNAARVPVYNCDCAACERARVLPEFRRRPACALLEAAGGALLLDAGLPDLGEQLPPGCFSRILLTHYHVDHVQGLFGLRWGRGMSVPVHGPEDDQGCADLHSQPGILDFSRPAKPFCEMTLEGFAVTPLPLAHSRPALGYQCEREGQRLAYLTDTAGLPAPTRDHLLTHQPDLLVLDCTYPPGRAGNHNDLDRALDLHQAIRPTRTLLTHISHELDCWLDEHGATLPDDVGVARDGLVIDL